jgi:hypothetical protein
MLMMANWTLLTSRARALLCIAHDPEVRRRDIAASQDTPERSAYGAPSPTRPKSATSWPFLPAPTRGRDGQPEEVLGNEPAEGAERQLKRPGLSSRLARAAPMSPGRSRP